MTRLYHLRYLFWVREEDLPVCFDYRLAYFPLGDPNHIISVPASRLLTINGPPDHFLNARTQGFKPSLSHSKKTVMRLSSSIWVREEDLNLRPQGYEPCELPTALPRDIYNIDYYTTRKCICQYLFTKIFCGRR